MTIIAGSQTTVSTTIGSLGGEGRIVALNDGGWVVIWSGRETSGMYDVKLQIYDVDGEAIGSTVTVSSTAAVNQYQPEATALSGGGFVVTWNSPWTDGDQSGIFQQAFNADGTRLGEEMGVNTYTASHQYLQDVVALEDGGWVVTWDSNGQDGSGTGIYQQIFTADAEKIGAETRVNSTTTNYQTTPDAALLSSGGWVVAWESNGQDGSQKGIFQQVYNADGSTVGSEVMVNTYVTGQQASPLVTALADGGWVVTWQSSGQDGSGEGVYQQAYDADGGTRGDETRVNTQTTYDQAYSQTIALTGGGWVVSWLDADDDGYGVYQQAFDASGDPVGGETLVNSEAAGYQNGQQMTALTGGGWVVTWQNAVYGDWNSTWTVSQRVFNADGTPDGDQMLLTETSDGEDVSPHVTALADGSWVVSWETDYSIQQRRFTLNEAPQLAEEIADQTASEDVVFSFQIASDAFTDDGDSLTYTATLADGDELPSWLSFDAETRTFSGTPGNDDDGQFTVKVTATDGSGESVSDTFEIDVSGTNDAPTLENSIADQSATEDQAFSFTFAASTFGDIDSGDSVSYSATLANGDDLPSWLSFNAGTRTFSGTPDNGNVGTVSVKVIATDSSEATASDTFDIIVANTSDAPTSSDSLVSTSEDTAYSLSAADFAFADVDSNALAAIVIGTLGSGTLRLDGAGVAADQEIALADLNKLVWTPDANAHGDAIPAFTFKVKDSTGATSVATHAFAVDVASVNDDPVAVADIAALTEGKTKTFNVLANDTDLEGDTLSLDVATVTSGNGTITFNADGTMAVTYAGVDLDKGATAEMIIHYDMSDGVGGSASATLTVTVTGVAEPGDPIDGGKGDDRLVGTNVAETISGGNGDDTLIGREGDDLLRGGSGDDILKGNGGNDQLSAGSGNDVLNGGDGRDILEGWSDNDRLTGGSGADTFIFHSGDGKDVITDFETSGKNHDLIDLSSIALFSSFKDIRDAMRETGSGVVIGYGSNSITVQGTDISDFSKEHFIL